MAFLDNSGDIILDAVLTDLGRKRLAAGRFNINKFALGDEEINYELWNSSDARGTAFYDLQILQTPILEAFTSDQSIMKSRLMTFSRSDLLYMPVLKVNNSDDGDATSWKPYNASNQFYIVADDTTFKLNGAGGAAALKQGIIKGYTHETDKESTKYIAVDQGLDSEESGMNVTTPMDVELLETSFCVKVDNRLLTISLVEGDEANTISPSVYQYLDDDYIAQYYFTRGNAGGAIRGPRGENFRARNLISDNASSEDITDIKNQEVYAGPLGRTLQIRPKVRNEVTFSDSLFSELGATGAAALTSFRGNGKDLAAGYKFIDTTITVEGMTTGYSIDIPIKIIKGTF
mgnify:CR=1 FL=1